MINLIQITKSFHDNLVLRGIDLELPNTGLITVLGESGSGKSTLLSILGGLDRPSKGEILFDGKTINDMDDYREKNISYIFQDCFLLENNTVYDNLYQYLLLLGITDTKEAERRIDQALNIVKLKKYKKHEVKNLSGGERQRVGIARATLRKNKIILADEPTGNLDIDNARLIMDILKGVSKDSLVVLVTHNKLLAEEYSDKIYTLLDGSITNTYTPIGDKADFSNNIYLSDFTLNEVSKDEVKIQTYDIDKLDISFYSIRGQIYYKSNQKIKNIEDGPYTLLNKREENSFKEVQNISLEYNEVPYKKNRRKEAVLYFFNKSKLNVLNRIFLVCIGFLLFMVSFFLTMSTKVDETKVRYTDTAYLVNKNIHNDGNGKHLDSSSLEDLIIENKVTDIVEEQVFDFYLFFNSYVKGKSEKALYAPLEYNNKSVLYGVSTVNKNEVIVSKALADSIRGDIALENILDYSLNINGTKTNKRIVGITDSQNYEVFYYNEMEYSLGMNAFSFDGTYKKILVVDDYLNESISLTRGNLPKNKKEILALDDGKTEISSKMGEYLISGFYELDASIAEDDKYEYILSIEAASFRNEYNMIRKIFNSKQVKNYLFNLHIDNVYKNVCLEKDYQYDAFFGEAHEKLISFVVPSLGISVLILGYVILMSFLMIRKMEDKLAFERVLGKKKFDVTLKVLLSSLIDAIIFIGVPYLLSGFVLLGLIKLNKTFSLGLSIINPYSSVSFYIVLLGMVLLYGLFIMIASMLKLKSNPSSLMKRIKK